MAPATLVADQGAGRVSLRTTLGRTAAFTLLNPHVYIDTVLLMGTIGSAQPAGARPVFVIGAGLASVVWFAGLGFGAKWLAPVFAKPGVWRILDAAVAALMLALACGLAARLL
jgi:L-lysine exporter family protein LysE/ArgO